MAKRWHPDKNPNCSSCQETFSRIAVAYETLSDESKRAAYDEAGGAASSELTSPKSVPLNRGNFDELVTFSNDVWIVQVFRPDNPHCASFHPFWENQIQKYQHLVRFGRIDVTDDQAKWLPLKVRVLPTVLKFGRHLGAVEIFPVTQMHETPQALTKFVLTSFPNIGLPLSSDRNALTSWLGRSTRRHKVLFAIPGKSEEERYKSHLVPRKLAAQWSEVFEVRSAETELLHALPAAQRKGERCAVPKLGLKSPGLGPAGEGSFAEGGAAALLFPALGGGTEPKAAAAFAWPTGEEEMVLELMRFTEMVGVSLSVQSAELLCRSLAMQRVPCLEAMIVKTQLVTFVLVVSDHVYCLVLLDSPTAALARAASGSARDLQESRATYQGEVAQIRESGGEVAEDEDNFVIPILRLLRHSSGLEPSVASCFAPKFPQVERALAGSSAFLMDLDTHRLAPLRLSLSSFKGLYPQIAYEDSLNWVEALEIRSLPDCSEGVRQRFVRQLSQSSFTELLWQLMFSLFLLEVIAKALASGSVLWWLGGTISLNKKTPQTQQSASLAIICNHDVFHQLPADGSGAFSCSPGASGMVVATLSRHSAWESGRLC
ncbi:PDIL2-2 [Symbiodinium necroappetens]|uniref:DnaJ homolog subfamily C member 16 n=1 Tax=Symbiodinium necroappetens TaxID=1628268 RepID=A0A813BCM6_9DINO|nr:PDIL2-2 [Symbiodinium necroappetens]